MKHLGADDKGPFSPGKCHYVADWIRDDSVPRHTYVRLDIGMAAYCFILYILLYCKCLILDDLAK